MKQKWQQQNGNQGQARFKITADFHIFIGIFWKINQLNFLCILLCIFVICVCIFISHFAVVNRRRRRGKDESNIKSNVTTIDNNNTTCNKLKNGTMQQTNTASSQSQTALHVEFLNNQSTKPKIPHSLQTINKENKEDNKHTDV